VLNNEEVVSKSRRSTIYKIEYPTLPSIELQPREVVLTQKQKHHDVLVLDYFGTSLKNANLLKTGIPVKFSWKQGRRSMEWLGYVSSVSREIGTQKSKPMKVYCVGSSFVLKQRKTKTYKDKTIPEIAASIAKENNLRFIGENHSRRFSQLVISGHTQWEWLHEQANRIGYAMYVQGTNLVFRPIDKIMDETSSDAPIFQLWDSTIPKQSAHPDRTLDYLKVMVGENIEGYGPDRSSKQIGGVNPVTGESFTAKRSPSKTGSGIREAISDTLFNDFNSDQVANSKIDAKNAAESSAHLARFNIPAKALGQGDPRVSPYKLIYVDGSGLQTDGFWLVNEVTHRLYFSGIYSVEMVILTDGTQKNRKNPKRNPDKQIIGFINVNQLLATQSSFSVEDNSYTVNLGVALGTSGVGIGNKTYASNASRTSRLNLRSPLLTQVNNQGFSRTPSRWETTVPSNTRVSNRFNTNRRSVA
jgi:phage protein D